MPVSPNMTAAVLALAATAILSFIDNFVVAISAEAGLWQFHVIRTVMVAPLLVLIAYLLRWSLRPRRWRWLALRSFAVSIGILIYFAALGTLTVAQAGAGLLSAPIWVLLFSALVFGTRIRVVQGLAIIAGFGGALLLLRPDFDNLSALSLMPLAAGCFYGLGMLLTRHRCAEENALALAAGTFLVMGLASLTLLTIVSAGTVDVPASSFMTRSWEYPSGRFLGLTLFQAVGSLVAVCLIAEAYRIGTPAFVAMFEYAFLIFASLWAYLLWGITTDLLGWIGIGVIAAAGIVMLRSEARKT